MPPVTLTLVLLNVAAYLAQGLVGDALFAWFALWPFNTGIGSRAPQFQFWQVVTYGFLHANFWHILVNMYAVYMFGSDLERVWGPRRYLALYFASIVTAACVQLVWTGMSQGAHPTVGASGGVFGLLLAFALYFPRRTIVLLIPPVPLPAWLFVTLYGILELYLGVSGTQAGVAHFAHLGGMLGAGILIWYWRNPRARLP
jgi:membrane associated rhomboid family serine protease